MALEFAHGAIQWLAADAATTVYTVSGLSFQPKALRFYWQGLGSAVDANSQTTHSRRGIGFAVSTSSRGCVATQDQDAVGTMVCTSGLFNDSIASTITSTPARDGALDLNSIASDGFTLIVDEQVPVDITVFWEAWGGSDIIAADVIPIDEPAAAGSLEYGSSGPYSVVMFTGIQSTSVAGTPVRTDSGLCVGFAAGEEGLINNVVIVGNSDDASPSSDTDGYCQTDECLAMIILGGGNIQTARAAVTSFLGTSGSFVLNWIERGTTDRRYLALAIRGGSWNTGNYTIAGNSGGATATVSGIPFIPKGICLIGRMTIEDTVDTATANDRIGIGTGTTTSSRRSMGHISEVSVATAEIDLTIQYNQVLSFPSTAGTLQSAYDINAMNSDGFEIIVDVAGGVASEWQGYLAFGDAPIGVPYQPWMQRAPILAQ